MGIGEPLFSEVNERHAWPDWSQLILLFQSLFCCFGSLLLFVCTFSLFLLHKGHYPTLAPPGGLTLHVEKLLNSSFRINLLCLKDLALFSQPSIYIDGWLYAMRMTSVVCNVPVLSQNDIPHIIILSSRHESDIPSLPGRQVSSS